MYKSKQKQIATTIENETDTSGCRQEQTNSRKADVRYTICLSSRTHNYSIDHRYWYNIIEFLGHIQRELQAAVASLLESLHYVCTMCILTLIVSMKSE